jgi:hypothetical protein
MTLGSVVVHLLAWVYLQPLLTNGRSAGNTTTLTPIEWVELDAPATAPSTPSDNRSNPTANVTEPQVSATAPALPSDPINNNPPTESSQTDEARDINPIENETDNEADSDVDPETEPVTEPIPEPVSETNAEQDTETPVPIVPTTEQLPPVPAIPTDSTTEPSTESTDGVVDDDANDATENTEENTEDDNLPTTGVNPNPVSQRYRITVSNIEERPVTVEGDRRDAYDVPPALLSYAEEYIDDPLTSDCDVTPDVQNNLGELVSFRVLIDRQGQVMSVAAVDEYAVSEAYLELAQCILQTWDFAPAQTEGQPVASDALIVELDIGRFE